VFLTPSELAELTGWRRAGRQAEWLRDHGWPVEVDRRGHPKVLRAVAVARLGGVVSSVPATEPNWDALHGTP
jgi:hypothetical protein